MIGAIGEAGGGPDRNAASAVAIMLTCRVAQP